MIVRFIIAGLRNGEPDLFAVKVSLSDNQYSAYLNGDTTAVSAACTRATAVGMDGEFHVYQPDRTMGIARRMKRLYDWAQIETVTLDPVTNDMVANNVVEDSCGASPLMPTA